MREGGGGADFLVISPPVTTPSEPPSGAFLLAGALKARGFSAPLLDLSLEFFDRLFAGMSGANNISSSLACLRNSREGFTPSRHRTASGVLHSALVRSRCDLGGWKPTLMDLAPPCDPHSPLEMLALSRSGGNPFEPLWSYAMDVIASVQPHRILVSVSYLSQLAAAIDLCVYLEGRGVRPEVGGSLPNSLRTTGTGAGLLERAFPSVAYGDGSCLVGEEPGTMLSRVVYPDMQGDTDWISPHPVIPFTLSTGCWWNRCLFCPDRDTPWSASGAESLGMFLDSIPRFAGRRPVLHLLDSAVPPAALRRALPVLKSSGAAFFCFARPGRELLESCPPGELADSGCLLLQLGAESASAGLLGRYGKGFGPDEWEMVTREVASGGIRTYLYLLFGLPGETGADRSLTVERIASLGDSVDFLNLSIFNLPRNCELASRADEFGMELPPRSGRGADGRIALYSEFTEGGVAPRREARLFLAGEAAGEPAFRSAALRTPRWFRAAHPAMMRSPSRVPVMKA